MSKVSNLPALELNFPSYYPCHFPLIDLQIKQTIGSSLLSLLPNAQMYSVPALFVDLAAPTPSPTWFHPGQFFKEKKASFQSGFFEREFGLQGVLRIF